jgi:hypothetical protein
VCEMDHPPAPHNFSGFRPVSMSAVGQNANWRALGAESGLPSIPDMLPRCDNGRKVPCVDGSGLARAWIGLVPKQNSSGGKDKLGNISKRGDRYLRSLFMTGALAVIRYAKIHGTKHRFFPLIRSPRRRWPARCEGPMMCHVAHCFGCEQDAPAPGDQGRCSPAIPCEQGAGIFQLGPGLLVNVSAWSH